MTFAVVAILGHFSKTLLLFFIPQVINFLYSVPQLFHLIPCPRHRLPKYNKETDTVTFSLACFEKQKLLALGRMCLSVLSVTRLASVRQVDVRIDNDGDQTIEMVECNNLTLINLVLRMTGPIKEDHLTILLLVLQIISSLIAFTIRYPLAFLLYGEIIV